MKLEPPETKDRRSRDNADADADTEESTSSDDNDPPSPPPPPPLRTLPAHMWSEPNADDFRVRGATYKRDGRKQSAGPSALRLFAVDVLEVASPLLGGVGALPDERLRRARRRGDAPLFTVIVNIALPGPPARHLVTYFAADDPRAIDGTDGTPFSRLARRFFFGDSDAFRDATFKLIPRVVEGNFVVRRAVGSTPAIMGTKLEQTYARGDGYFEIVLDVGSSAVAANVVWLALGYAKSLVVDMAFVLEGNDESTLPERVMGCCRLHHVDVELGRFCEGGV